MSAMELPPLPPVRFSFADADHLADELQTTAGLLEQVVAQLDSDLPLVREDWQGGLRDTFELEVRRARLGLTFLAASMRASALHVRRDAVRAAAENRLRARGMTGS